MIDLIFFAKFRTIRIYLLKVPTKLDAQFFFQDFTEKMTATT